MGYEGQEGHIKRITDSDIQSSVLEVMGTNVSTNYHLPSKSAEDVGYQVAFLVMIIKKS